MPLYIKKCRNCNSKSIINLFSLGKIRFTGKFPKYKEKIPHGELNLVMCKSCKLVQLKHIFNMSYLYNKDYGYRTGINLTMSNHVKNVVRKISKVAKLKSGDSVLDIASNDGTLLRNYNSKIKMIVFITDGAVGNEQKLFNLVENNLGNSRLFSIGIGSAPNSHLLEKISRKGRGTYTYVSHISDVSTKVTKLFDKIEAPVLTNIQLSLDGKSEIYPNPIPDLFMDEPLVVFGKVDNVKNLSATFSGKNNYGHFKIDIPISFTNSEKHPSISGIWARKKIASYMDDWHLAKSQEVKQKVINIALAHNLVSKFTSFVAVEHKIVNPTGNAIPVPIKVNLPEGWNYDKVFGAPREIMKNQAPIDKMQKNHFTLPKTGTNMPSYLIYGLMLILLSTWILINPQIKCVKKK